MNSRTDRGSDPSAVGIVLTHGSMCFGMVDAVERIAGPSSEALVAVSNEGRSPEELIRVIRETAAGRPAIVFTDLKTGSCALAARLACASPEGTKVVFGTNLAMLLDFIFHRELPLDALRERLIDRGRHSIDSPESEVTERGDPSVSRG